MPPGRSLLIAVAALSLGAAACSDEESAPTPTIVSGDGWKISFPDEVDEQTQEASGLDVTLFIAETHGDAFAVAATKLPKGVTFDLDAAVTGAVNGISGSGDVTLTGEVESGPVTIDGVEGRQFTVRGVTEDDDDVDLRGVIALHGGKVIQAHAVDREGDHAAEVAAFIDSLQLN